MSLLNLDCKWEKSSLVTNGVKFNDIPGLYTVENHTIDDLMSVLHNMTKDSYSHEEIFGSFCSLGDYIDCPVEKAFEYAANVYSLEEWTFGLRDFEYVGGGLYRGIESFMDNTAIYIKSICYPEVGVVDYPCAWDQGKELWMNYYCRFIDAMPTIGKPGTIVLWTNCKHPYYNRDTQNVPDYITQGINRKGRVWVGDVWNHFDSIHKIEMANLKNILEYRFKNA